MTRLLTEVFKVPLCDNCVYQNIPSSIGCITLKLSKGQIKSVRKGTSTIRDEQQEEKDILRGVASPSRKRPAHPSLGDLSS